MRPAMQQLHSIFISRFSGIFAEARDLFHRRKLSYALLAVAVTASSVYVGATGYSMATQEGTTAHDSTNQYPPQTTDVITEPLQSTTDSGNANERSGDSKSSTSSQTTVIVNGRQIDIPENGSIHTHVSSGSDSTTVDITHASSGTTNSNLSVRVQSSNGGNAANGDSM